MARGRSQPGVKTHRRGRRRRTRRRFPVAPWIVISTVLTLVVSGLVIGYTWLLGTGCSGEPLRATLVAAPDIKEPLSVLARQVGEDDEPSIDGRCIGVDVRGKSSAEVATRLATTWDTVTDGAEPHIWVPDSSVWIQMAQTSDSAAAMIPDKTPFVATSPTVIAMPQPMAEALGWDAGSTPVDLEPSWANLLALAEEKSWSDFGQDWGDITLGMSSPRESTAGLHALLSLTDVDRNNDVDDDELNNVVKLNKILTESPPDTDTLLNKMAEQKELNDYVSAFPALERDVWRYNTYMDPEVELTAVYPSDGSIDADHPLAVLQNVGWTDKTYQEIGWQFAEFITGDAGQEVLLEEAFRDGTRRTGGDTLNNAAGLTPQIAESQRGPLVPDAVSNAMFTWQALKRPANVLVVLDTSDSMASVERAEDGEDVTRLDIVRDELADALTLFGSQANVGLWQYSSNISGGKDYLPLVDIAEFDEAQETRIKDAADGLVAGGASALYDTAVAAYEELLNNYNDTEGAANLVVIISDGGNDDPSGGLTLEQMQTQLDELGRQDDRSKKASIVTIGLGKDIDEDALTAVAEATRGKFFGAEWLDQLSPQLLNALFNAI